MDTHDLKPGRETDFLVAEKVMGWTFKQDAKGEWTIKDQNGDYRMIAHPYSTDISYAWEIVAKLGEELTDLSLEKAGLNWHFSTPLGAATDLTPAMAICRAALKVVELKAKASSKGG